MPFIAIRELRELFKSSFNVTSRADFHILIDLAAATQSGEGLTMKQLVIMQSGSATTTRRRINNLIAAGKVVKLPHASDGRSEVYGVSQTLWELSAQLQESMQKLYGEFDVRSEATGVSANKTPKSTH
jgi:hypothetical protein